MSPPSAWDLGYWPYVESNIILREHVFSRLSLIDAIPLLNYTPRVN